MSKDCLNLVIVGVGGQGIILVSRIIGEAALKSDLNVMVSEIHGMAQRGGIVVSMIRIGDVHSPMIGKGEADIIWGLEPVETYRHLDFASNNTYVVTSTNPVYPFTVSVGEEGYPELSELFESLENTVKKVIKLDAEKLATNANLPLIVTNIIMLGALKGACPGLPVTCEKLKESIKENVPSKYSEANIKAFDLGFEEANTN